MTVSARIGLLGRPPSLARIVGAATAFGTAMALVKGDHSGLRGGIGNLSAPWVVVALLAGASAPSVGRAARAGLAATVAALVAFYGVLTLALRGHLGGGGFAVELATEVRANRIYFLFGLVTGPIGAMAGRWLAARSARVLALAVGGTLIAEIAVVRLVAGRQLLPAPLYFSWGVDSWTPYVGESLVGGAVVVLALFTAPRMVPER